MSDFIPIGDLQRSAAIQRMERLRKREVIRKAPASGEDSVVTTGNLALFQSMVDKMADTPEEVRPEMVELGKKLANSKDFPTPEMMDQLAEALLGSLDDLKVD